ncbi:MAG: glycosyltransferase family 39 protein [Verrucomicrobia bacterium]|nr:glycosyltransferase family 39 protein [Verrucomicrobiota bacterium]
MARRLPVWLGAVLLIAASLALRWPSFPREVWNLDEANTTVFAEHLLHGDVMYRDVVDTRSPLMAYVLAAGLRVAGDWNNRGLHAGLAVMLGLAALLLWRLVRRLDGSGAGGWSAAVFVAGSVLMFDPVDAFTTHTEWFVVFFSALGFWLLAHAWRRVDAALATLAGFAFGLSYLSKQPGLLDGLVAIVWLGLFLIFDPAGRRSQARLLAGVAAGLLAVALAAPLYFWARGALREYQFYVWTFSTRYYLPEIPAGEQWRALAAAPELAARHLPLFAVAAAFGVTLCLRGLTRAVRLRLAGQEVPLLALGWTASGVIASALGGRAFDHYCIQALPGISLLAGWALDLAWQRGRTAVAWRALAVLPFAVATLQAVQRLRTLDLDPGPGPIIGATVREWTKPDERIFVWGFYPEANYYSRRLSASRHVFSNHLTGLIPWTNVDPDRDTSYAVLPNAWTELWTDFDRHPPAAIVDTGTRRFYGKYPLSRQTRLWRYVLDRYTEVEGDRLAPVGFRLFRRRSAPLPATAGLAEDPALVIRSAIPGDAPTDRYVAILPAGTVAAEFRVNGRGEGAVALPPGRAHQLSFYYRPQLHGLQPAVAVCARRADGTLVTGPARVLPPPPPVPTIRAGDFSLPAVESECLTGPPVWLPADQVFSAHAPAHLVFERPAALLAVSIEFGLFDGAFAPERHPPTNGVELQVSFTPEHGPRRRLATRAIYPAAVAADRGRQRVEVDLPPRQAGRLEIAITPGRDNDASSDWSYFGKLEGKALPVTMVVGNDVRLPDGFEAPYGIAAVDEDGQRLALAPAPTMIEFQLPEGVQTVSGDFMMLRSSWTQPQGHSAGVDFVAELVDPAGRATEIWRQRLDPARQPGDRGLHHFRLNLGLKAPARLRLRSAAAHPPDNSYGDAGWGRLVAQPAS